VVNYVLIDLERRSCVNILSTANTHRVSRLGNAFAGEEAPATSGAGNLSAKRGEHFTAYSPNVLGPLKQDDAQLGQTLTTLLLLLKNVTDSLKQFLDADAILPAPATDVAPKPPSIIPLKPRELEALPAVDIKVRLLVDRLPVADEELDPFDALDFADGKHGGAGVALEDYEWRRIWSEVINEDDWAVELSGKPKGQKPDDLKAGVSWQYKPYPWLGHDSRVPYLEVIKLAMSKYGQSVDSVLEKVTAVPGGYDIIMKDGVALNITHKELHLASKACGFVGFDEGMVNDASFLFGVLCKRIYLTEQAKHFADNEPWTRSSAEKIPKMRTYAGVLALTPFNTNKHEILAALGLRDAISTTELAKGPRERKVRQHNY
jgi:hypothetical protein